MTIAHPSHRTMPPGADVRARLAELAGSPPPETTGGVRVQIGDRRADVPADVAEALVDLLRRLGEGSGVLVSSVDEYVTTGHAASILGVSRSYVSRLLDQDALPYEFRGTHRRIRTVDVLAYLDERRRERAAALDEVSRLSREAGLYDDEF